MKKLIIKKVETFINEHGYDAEKLVKDVNRGYSIDDIIEGKMPCYYSECFDAMRERYGDDFDESRYMCKNGEDLKYRHNVPYIWIQYKNHLRLVMNKMLRKGVEIDGAFYFTF